MNSDESTAGSWVWPISLGVGPFGSDGGTQESGSPGDGDRDEKTKAGEEVLCSEPR